MSTPKAHEPAFARGRDRAICRELQTHPSELEEILPRSRQTISRKIEEDKLFGPEEVLQVAARKIADPSLRSQTVTRILNDWFPEVIRSTRDTEVARFARYCILGMAIPAEIAAHTVFEDFIRLILSDQKKFVLFVSRPQKEHAQLKRWLRDFQAERHKSGKKTASFAVLPCKLVELSPIQIIADPWSNDPKFIQLAGDHLFVDGQNEKRAATLANALMDYGLSERVCDTIDQKEVQAKLVRDLNQSLYDVVESEENQILAKLNR
jgi:hypothetical protein